MDLRLKGKVVLVTGGAKGIGAAIVRGCCAEGAIPVIVDRDEYAGEQLQVELRTSRVESGLIVAELSAPEACANVVDGTIQKLGRLDALVNNAGVNDGVGLDCEQQLEDSGDRAGRNFGLRGRKGRHSGTHARVGCGASSARDSRQRGGARGGDDAALSAVAGHISRPAAEASGNCFKDSARQAHDEGGRDSGHGAVPDLGASKSHHRPAPVRGWRIRAFGPRPDITETTDDEFPGHSGERRSICPHNGAPLSGAFHSHHQSVFLVGLRRQSERHPHPTSEKGFWAYRFSVFFYPGGIFWRVFPGGLSRRAGDGEDRIQERNPCGSFFVRRGGGALSAGIFFAGLRLLSFRAVRDGLRAELPRSRSKSLRDYPWSCGKRRAPAEFCAVVQRRGSSTFADSRTNVHSDGRRVCARADCGNERGTIA